MFINHYKTLGLRSFATENEIKKAYRTLAKKYHPDVNSDPQAHSRFLQVQQAYEVLSDHSRRRTFDELLQQHSGTAQSQFARQESGSRPFSRSTFDESSRQHFAKQESGSRPFGSPEASASANTNRPGQADAYQQPGISSKESISARLVASFFFSAVGVMLILAGIGKLVSGGSSLSAIASATAFFLLGLGCVGGGVMIWWSEG